eukprot:jgi/Chlat1/7324/Chrsp58S06926
MAAGDKRREWAEGGQEAACSQPACKRRRRWSGDALKETEASGSMDEVSVPLHQQEMLTTPTSPGPSLQPSMVPVQTTTHEQAVLHLTLPNTADLKVSTFVQTWLFKVQEVVSKVVTVPLAILSSFVVSYPDFRTMWLALLPLLNTWYKDFFGVRHWWCNERLAHYVRMDYHKKLWGVSGVRCSPECIAYLLAPDGREIVAGTAHHYFICTLMTSRLNDKPCGHQLLHRVQRQLEDCLVKVWDRLLRSGASPQGVLIGHGEGITHVTVKYLFWYGKEYGNRAMVGRLLSNNKDQSASRLPLGASHSARRPPLAQQTPAHGCWTVVTHQHELLVVNLVVSLTNRQAASQYGFHCGYAGHSFLQALVRAHSLPAATTAQRCLYMGLSCGAARDDVASGKLIGKLAGHDAIVRDASIPFYPSSSAGSLVHNEANFCISIGFSATIIMPMGIRLQWVPEWKGQHKRFNVVAH